jgi:hypothetical protein
MLHPMGFQPGHLSPTQRQVLTPRALCPRAVQEETHATLGPVLPDYSIYIAQGPVLTLRTLCPVLTPRALCPRAVQEETHATLGAVLQATQDLHAAHEEQQQLNPFAKKSSKGVGEVHKDLQVRPRAAA